MIINTWYLLFLYWMLAGLMALDPEGDPVGNSRVIVWDMVKRVRTVQSGTCLKHEMAK